MPTATTLSASVASSTAAQHPLKLNGQQVSQHRSHCVRKICLFNQSINDYIVCYFFKSTSLPHSATQFFSFFCILLLSIASATLFKIWYYWFKLSTNNNINHNNKYIIINICSYKCIGYNDIQTSAALQPIIQHTIWGWYVNEFSELFKCGITTHRRSNRTWY